MPMVTDCSRRRRVAGLATAALSAPVLMLLASAASTLSLALAAMGTVTP